jgi:hypothetical protein
MARLQSGTLIGAIDFGRPQAGLHHIQVNDQSIESQLLCVQRQLDDDSRASGAGLEQQRWPLPVSEAYVRGDDLVVSYEPNEEWPYSPQIYWRAREPKSMDDFFGGITVLLSVHTHLLDTWPRISVESKLEADEVLCTQWNAETGHLAERLQEDRTIEPTGRFTCVIHRMKKTQLSYAEVMAASDFRHLQASTDEKGRLRTRWSLFAEFLEKGVIRRARVHSAFVSRDNDVELARGFCEAVARESLPLTA